MTRAAPYHLIPAVIVRLDGGLGNQMFQYAAARAIALRSACTTLLDTRLYFPGGPRELDISGFNIKAWKVPGKVAARFDPDSIGGPLERAGARLVKLLKIPAFADRHRGFEPEVARYHGPCFLRGYWQCERYFAGIRHKLLREMTPRATIPSLRRQLLKEIQSDNSVCVHVRRGDLITNPHYAQTFGTTGADYYRHAIERMRQVIGKARIYLFSDDPQWAETNVRSDDPVINVSGSYGQSAVEDFRLMTACRHFITANSTYSWWAAWLGTHRDKTVITPEHWYKTRLGHEDDLIPLNWLRC